MQEWLSLSEFARRSDMSDMTIRRRIKRGHLKAELKDGKYLLAWPQEQEGFFSTSSPSFSSSPSSASLPEIRDFPALWEQLTRHFEKTDHERNQHVQMRIETYQHKIDHLETVVASLEKENEWLKQQVEDLETLLSVLESKSNHSWPQP
jgi:hypothetical protein